LNQKTGTRLATATRKGVFMLTMLMPIGDDNEGRHSTPYVTYILIAINLAVFFLLQMPSDAFTYGYATVPAEITRGVDITRPVQVDGAALPHYPGPQPIYLTLFTAMFMHGGFAHIFGNMLYLWIFGDNVEDAMGHVKFLIFYLLCGLAASAAHIFSEPNSLIPSLGASGAIAGVLGGYLLMFPSRQVRVLIGWVGIVAMPALIVIGFWGVLQFLGGFGSIARTEQTGGGVAYWAHVGGFIAGLVLVNLFRNARSRERAQQRMQQPADFNNPWNRPY
jgi:membrane associated rhomboid family serine protease